MAFREAKSKSLEEMIKTEDKDAWETIPFQKLLDAKIGIEIQRGLYSVTSYLDVVSRNIKTAVDSLITSNKELSDSNNKYARALCWLTGGLVFVGLLSYIEKIFRLFIK